MAEPGDCKADEFFDPLTRQCLKKPPLVFIDPIKLIGDFVTGVMLDVAVPVALVYVGYRVLRRRRG